MARVYYPRQTTVVGKAMWFKVNNIVDVFDGDDVGYAAPVYFDEATIAKFKEDAKAMLEEQRTAKEFTNEKTGKPLKWRDVPRSPIKEDDEGNEYVVFKTYHLLPDGSRKKIPVFDSSGRPLEDVTIGNGSLVQIAYTPSVFHNNVEQNGVKFYLDAIMVDTLVEFGGAGGTDAKSFGFKTKADEYFPDDEPFVD